MSGTVPPIPPPLGANPSNASSPNIVHSIPIDNTNSTTTTNAAHNVVNEDLSQLLDSIGGSHVTNVLDFDVEVFSSWKDRFLVYLDGLEPYLLDILENGPFTPNSEFLADLNAEFHDRALLANQNRFYKRSGRIGSAKKPMDKSKETCFACEDYNGKYKGLKDEIDVLTKKIDAMSKRKSEKGLVAESFDWDDESISSEDEGITRKHVLDYTHVDLHYVEDQGKNLLIKFNSLNQELSSSDLKKVIEKWISSKVTIDQRLTEQVPSNIFCAIGGRGKRKDAISLKEVLFNKADKSPSETAFEITSDFESECNNQEPLPPLLKLSEAEPIVKVIKKKAQTKSPSVPDPSIIKKADSSIEHLLLTLMEEVVIKKTLAKLKAQSSPSSFSRKAPKIPKPFIPYVTSVVALLMKPLTVQRRPPPTTGNQGLLINSGCSRHMTQVKQYLHIYSKESGPKVVFGENSSGDTEGYDSVNCNVITFTRVANVNGLKHNLISISQLCDANFKKKSEAADCTMSFIKKMENLNELRVKELRSDNRTEFRNHKLEEFYDKKGISHNFSSPCTLEQNGVAERRNRTLIEAARTIGRSPEVSYFYVFGCPVFIQNHKDHLGKFDEKADDGFFLGYSPVAKSFRVFNIRRQEMEETYHVTFSEDDEAISQTSTKGDEINFNKNNSFLDDKFLEPRSKTPQSSGKDDYFPYVPTFDPLFTNNIIIPDPITPTDQVNNSPDESSEFSIADDHPDHHEPDDFEPPESHNNTFASVTTRSRIRDFKAASTHEYLYVNFLSEIKPKKLVKALEEEEGWIISMQEELNQFERNKV
ncbi:retrovirus-related pol polyprotein from transposon TNT 1-94 [Tanacetum coccineum]